MLTYFLQVNVCWLLFYGAYYALLSKETFFRLNRIWLIASLLCGLALPFMADYFAVKVVPTELFVATLEPFVVTATALQHDLALDTEGGVLRYLAAGYLIGVVALANRFLAGLFLIFKLFFQSKKEKKDGFLLVNTDGTSRGNREGVDMPPFSFFKLIFINPNGFNAVDYQQIMQHEIAHVRQRHSYDVVFLELLNIVFWCSPLIYFYKESLRNVHEYLADQAVLRPDGTPQYKQHRAQYGRLLLRQQQSSWALSLTNNISNQFFSQLKKRILMMTRNPSRRRDLVKYALAAPIFLILTMVLASPKTPILAKTEVFSAQAIASIDNFEKEKLAEFNAMPSNIQNGNARFLDMKEGDTAHIDVLSISSTKRHNMDSLPKIKEGETIVYIGNYKSSGPITASELQKTDKLNVVMMVNGKLEEGIIQSYVVVRVPRSKDDDPMQVNVSGNNFNESLKKLVEMADAGDQYQFFHIKSRWAGDVEVREVGTLSLLVKDYPFNAKPFPNNIDPNDIKSVNVNKDEVKGNSVTIEMKNGTVHVLKGEELKRWIKDNEQNRVKIYSDQKPIYTVVDENPEFPQGQTALFKWLSSNTQYPKEARDNKIEGTVYVGFVVNPDGSISDITVKRGIGGGCNQEAVRVISVMPDWKPGKHKGEAVRVAYTLPIKFKLEDTKKEEIKQIEIAKPNKVEHQPVNGIYTIVDQNPEFPQGMPALFKWLGQNIKYPEIARKAKGEGTVYVGFVVEKDGSITDVKIKRDAPVIVRDTITLAETNGIKANKVIEKTDYSLGKEAVRVISAMPKWKAGKQNGVPVRVAYTLPIKFKLE